MYGIKIGDKIVVNVEHEKKTRKERKIHCGAGES